MLFYRFILIYFINYYLNILYVNMYDFIYENMWLEIKFNLILLCFFSVCVFCLTGCSGW